MTFYRFCAKHFIPFQLVKSFGEWIGSVKDNVLPEKEWKRLWEEFYNE